MLSSVQTEALFVMGVETRNFSAISKTYSVILLQWCEHIGDVYFVYPIRFLFVNCSAATHKFRKRGEMEKKDFVAKKIRFWVLFLKLKMARNAFYVSFLLPYVFTTIDIPYMVHTFHISIKCQKCFEVVSPMAVFWSSTTHSLLNKNLRNGGKKYVQKPIYPN